MTNRDEKLADATIQDLQRPASGGRGRRRNERKRRERGRQEEEEEEVSQVETKEGEEALRFFRGRDFETCLSALKSREIKEPRPKPGKHV